MNRIFIYTNIFISSTFLYKIGLISAMSVKKIALWEAYLINFIGGFVGIIIFTYFGAQIKEFLSKKFPNLFKQKKHPKAFIAVRKYFGLVGVASLSPILSMPLGVTIALSMTDRKHIIIYYMTISCFLWSASVYLLDYFLNINLFSWISHLF